MGICGSKEEKAPTTSKMAAGNTAAVNTSTAGKSTQLSGTEEKVSDPTIDITKKSLATVEEDKELTNVNNNILKQTVKALLPKQQAKVLLLGAGESGKSTILKQIKIIHQNGFSERERRDYRPFVFQNIVSSAQYIVKELQKKELVDKLVQLSSSDLDYILNFDLEMDDETKTLDDKTTGVIQKLVTDNVVKELINDHGSEFYLIDSAKYFFSNLNRIFQHDYIPSETDILRTRRQTSGIFDTKFQLDGLDVHLYDVGGQRSERKKWIHCFDNVTAIMFCVALSEYDQNLLESSMKNRLEESLNLFESVTNSMWFRKTSIILCLNKIDIFIEKLPKSPLENYFPDYVGGNDVGKAVKYILWRFKQLNRSNLNLVPYVTQATDTENIKSAFAVVKETIIHNNLVDSGVISSLPN